LPTPRADVYAVGAMLARWSRQAVHDAPYLALLTTACAASLDARFADAKALLAALEQMPLPAAVPAAPASAPATQPSPDDAFRWTSLLNPDGTVRATR
jgi:hypothetical protein